MQFKLTPISFVYIALSISGAYLPTYANIQFMKAYGPGFDISTFIQLANTNPAAQSLSSDLLVLSSSIFIWMCIECRRLQIRHFWVVVLGTFSIAIAFSAPLFLFLRERRILELQNYEPSRNT